MNDRIKKVFYAECQLDSKGKVAWQLMLDEKEALHIDPNYRLAKLEDLEDWAAATGETFGVNGEYAIQCENGYAVCVDGDNEDVVGYVVVLPELINDFLNDCKKKRTLVTI